MIFNLQNKQQKTWGMVINNQQSWDKSINESRKICKLLKVCFKYSKISFYKKILLLELKNENEKKSNRKTPSNSTKQILFDKNKKKKYKKYILHVHILYIIYILHVNSMGLWTHWNQLEIACISSYQVGHGAYFVAPTVLHIQILSLRQSQEVEMDKFKSNN